MSKNLVLFLSCVALGTFTYFYQEIGEREERKEKEISEEILNFKAMGELRGFQLPSVEVEYAKDKYYLKESGDEIDPSRVNKFLGQLSFVKVRRVLEKKEVEKRSNFIPTDEFKMAFTFENGTATFTLGDKLGFSRDFYLEVEKEIRGKVSKQIIVAFNSEVVDEVYAKEIAHKSDHLYRRFKSLYYLSEEFFRDHRIFGQWMDSKWSLQRVYIDNNRTKGHSVLLDKRNTNPKCPSFLSFDLKKAQEFEKALANLSAKRIVAFNNPKILDNEKREAMIIVSSTKGNTRFNLYKDLNQDLKGYFIAFADKNLLYEITDEQAGLFLGSVEKYWKMNLWDEMNRPKSLSISFNGKSYKVDLPERGSTAFKVDSDKGEAVHLEFQKLINFLGQPSSYWVSGEELATSSIKQFSLDWGEGEFFLMIRSDEVVLYHRESKQGLVYSIKGQMPIGLVEGEYFL